MSPLDPSRSAPPLPQNTKITDGVCVGFPSPAEDYTEERLDLNRYLVRNPAATFFVRVDGHDMTGVGIHDGDILVVDRSIDPADGMIVIAVVEGSLTVKRFRRRGRALWLEAAHRDIPINEGDTLSIWGVATSVIHAFGAA
ncbi:MAG: translesion error-prone DNA polymerase V autoproteolytic subunit [Magnetococcales bacterium]|nr:translesion error-prone DNA polymerase V autoproteolytic subunit [Magnetococcales bacterium]